MVSEKLFAVFPVNFSCCNLLCKWTIYTGDIIDWDIIGKKARRCKEKIIYNIKNKENHALHSRKTTSVNAVKVDINRLDINQPASITTTDGYVKRRASVRASYDRIFQQASCILRLWKLAFLFFSNLPHRATKRARHKAGLYRFNIAAAKQKHTRTWSICIYASLCKSRIE